MFAEIQPALLSVYIGLFVLILITVLITVLAIKQRKNRNPDFAPLRKRIAKIIGIAMGSVVIVTTAITLTLNLAFGISPFCYFWGYLADVMILNIISTTCSVYYTKKERSASRLNTAAPKSDQ